MSKAPADRQQSVVALSAQLRRALEVIAADEAEPTETLDRATLTPGATAAPARPITVPPPSAAVAAPPSRLARTHVAVSPRAGWRTHLPLVAAYATLCAGGISLAITLGTLLGR